MPEYVYGVVAADVRPPSTTGPHGESIRTVSGDGGVAALVSHVDTAEVTLGREEIMSHSRVLTDALSAGPVLPMRLGIVMNDEDDVRERLLKAHADELGDQLAQFRDKFEATIRVVYEEDALMQEVIASNPDVARLREAIHGRDPDATYYERIQLGQLVAEAVERIRERDAENLLSALRQVSLDHSVQPPGHERIALSASFLLDKQHSRQFDEVLEALAEGQAGRLRFRYTGPLAPHSFVELAGAG